MIVLEQVGQVQLFDPSSRPSHAADRSPSPATSPSCARSIVNVARRLTNAHISPTGARALFEARGEILTVPAEKGDARNLTSTPGVMERDPAWSPDGQWIAYFSDESGEYELHVRDSMGRSEARKIRLEPKPTFYFMPRWSPDSKKIAFMDAHLNTWYVDIDARKPVKIDKDRYLFPPGQRVPVWSPDSKWIAYTKRLTNYLSAIFLYSLADGEEHAADRRPQRRPLPGVRQGRQVSLLHRQHRFGSLARARHPQRHPSASRSLYIVVLSKSDPSPLLARERRGAHVKPGEEKKAAEEKKAESTGAGRRQAGTAGRPRAGPDVRIDFDKIDQRILALPLPARRYVGLQAGQPGHAVRDRGVRLPAAGVARHDRSIVMICASAGRTSWCRASGSSKCRRTARRRSRRRRTAGRFRPSGR